LILALYKSDCSTAAGWGGSNEEVKVGWHHYSLSVDSSGNLKMYRDGVLFKSNTFLALSGSSWDSVCSTANNWIDIGNYAGNRGWAGSLDDFKIFNYARTPAQIAWDYNRGKPVGWWKMDEGEGTTAYDSSGNNQNLTLVNAPTWSSGKFNNSLDFEKDNSQYGYTADSSALSITKDLTVAAWVKPESCSGRNDWVIAGKWDGENISYLLRLNACNLQMCIESVNNYKRTDDTLTTGNWYHVTGVYNATAQTVTLYVNGVDKGGTVSGTIPSLIGDDADRFHIGAKDSSTAATDFFDGQIDDVRVYNYALTGEQVKQVMNEGSAVRFGN
jgi:hypothetical protein